jgi:hypothetical protein
MLFRAAVLTTTMLADFPRGFGGALRPGEGKA